MWVILFIVRLQQLCLQNIVFLQATTLFSQLQSDEKHNFYLDYFHSSN